MTSPGRVGKAYLEITADYDKFAREAEVKINAALRKVGANLDSNPFGNKVSAIGSNVGTAFGKGFEDGVENAFRAGATRLNSRIATAIDNDTTRSRTRNAFDNLGRYAVLGFGAAIAAVLGGGQGIGKFFESIKDGGSVLSSILDGVNKSAGNFLIKLGLMIIVVPHLAGVVFTLIGNLTSLLGLLNAIPGLAGIAIGALLPLIVAFQGFGDAISAILDGDPDKITEALKKLSPSAKAVAQEIQGLLPQFRAIKSATQEAFFAPIRSNIADVFKEIGEGKIATGFSNVANAMGLFVAQFIRLGTAPGVQKLAGILFGDEGNGGAISRIIGSLSGPVTRLLDGLANAGASTLPTLEKLFARIGGWVDHIAQWLNEQAANGEFDNFLKSALQTAGDLKDLAGALLDLFLSIFEGTDDGGERFLQKVTKAVEELTAYFESPDGKQALQAMVGLAESFANFLGVAASFLAEILSLLGKLDAATGGGGGGKVAAKVTAAARAKGYAEGGIVDQPTFAMIGEAGREAVIPLDNPSRAAEIMGQAGLLPLAGSMMAGGGLNVVVYLGTKQITDILDSRVSRGLSAAAGSIARVGRQG